VNPSIGAQVGVLILATSAVQLASGFIGTFLSLRVALENFTGMTAALVLRGYFAGFTIGAPFCIRIVGAAGCNPDSGSADPRVEPPAQSSDS